MSRPSRPPASDYFGLGGLLPPLRPWCQRGSQITWRCDSCPGENCASALGLTGSTCGRVWMTSGRSRPLPGCPTTPALDPAPVRQSQISPSAPHRFRLASEALSCSSRFQSSQPAENLRLRETQHARRNAGGGEHCLPTPARHLNIRCWNRVPSSPSATPRRECRRGQAHSPPTTSTRASEPPAQPEKSIVAVPAVNEPAFLRATVAFLPG